MDVSKWFNYYSFDVMGDLAYGKSFDMLTGGEAHSAIQLLGDGQRPLGLLSPLPWLFPIVTRLPIVSADYWKFIKWSGDQAEKRKQVKVTEPDIMSHLLEADPISKDAFEEKIWLIGDSRLIIVAGSDTTAATLTHVFYHLVQDPSQMVKLQHELIPVWKEEEINMQTLQSLDHLNGVINESLRLHPPVPSGLLRLTPPEGIRIGDHYVPGNVTIGMPTYTLMRSPKAFEQPNAFLPERWYSKPEMVKHKSAFVPISIGPFGCIGKQLALMELRTVVAKLVINFDVQFAPGEDGTTLLTRTEDYFTLGLANMFLTFTPRKV